MQGADTVKVDWSAMWYVVAPAFAIVALAAFALGCAHRPIVCTMVKIDGEPAIMCADADVVKGQDIRPYSPTPAPELPPSYNPPRLSPWRERHGDKAGVI